MHFDKASAMLESVRYANTLVSAERNDLKKAIYECELRHIVDKNFPEAKIYEQYMVNGFRADCVALIDQKIVAIGEAKTNLSSNDMGAFMEATAEIDCFRFVLCGNRPDPRLSRSGVWYRGQQRGFKIYNLSTERLAKFDARLMRDKDGVIPSMVYGKARKNTVYKLSDNLVNIYGRVKRDLAA